MDLNELASDLFGSKRAESSTQPSTVSVMYGIATSDSADGLVSVWLSDNALSPTDAQAQWETVDSYDADAYEGMDESTSIEIPTEVTCLKDDVVRVQLMGAGAAKNPTVVGVVGRGDEQNQRISDVEGAADVARANNQHFWTDTNGAHVTDEEQDDWVAEYKKSGHGTLPNPTDAKPWHNILLNSVGILLRRGLLTLVSITKNAVSFFDGTGTVTASFGPSGAQIGPENGRHAILDSNGLSVVNADGTKAPITGELSGYDIKDSTIVGSKFVDGTIEGSKIASSTITSTQISDSSITGSKIDASTFADGQISGSKINASTFTDGQISGSKIANSTITATQIADSTITGSKIADSSITGGKIQGATLTDIPFAAITDAEIEVAAIADAEIASAHISYAQVDDLDANYARIDLVNADVAWLQNGLIKDASISDAKIIGVSANKLTAGTIDAAEINVMNLRADNLKVSRVNGQPVLGGYSLVDPSGSGYASKNPKTQGWYELTANGYVLTDDTTVVSGKAYYTTSTSVELYDQDYIDALAEDLSDRIDGAIETFTSSTVPTPNNYPASDWTTDDIRATHVGDVCYVLNEASDSDGWCYRYAYDNTTHQYGWVLIKDSDVTKALYELTDPNGELKTFETQTSTWKTATDNEITSIKSSQTSLEGRMTTAEGQIALKVDSSTFNTVSQTVNENVARINTLTTTTSTLANPNLSPFYSNEFYDGTYWSSANSPYSSELGKCFTQLEDGWAHVDFDNSERTSNAYHNIYVKQPIDHIKPDTTYTFVYEVRNLSIVGDGALVLYGQDSQASDQMASHSASITITEDGVYRMTFTSRSSFTDAMVRPVRVCLRIGASTNAQLDVRASLYEGEYSGPYKPYINAYTVTTISNTVNEVKQTATSNSTTISQLTQTLGTNLDGTSATNDIVHRTTKIEQDLDGITTTVGRIDSEMETVSNPNLSPYFSMPIDDVYDATDNVDGYWKRVTTNAQFTTYDMQVEHNGSSGWAHFAGTATSSNPYVRFEPMPIVTLKPSTKYTFVIEADVIAANVTNIKIQLTGGQSQTDTKDQFATALEQYTKESGVFYIEATTVSDFSSANGLSRSYFQIYGTGEFDAYVRISLFEGEYKGQYKPYVDQMLTTRVKAAETSIVQNAEAISLNARSTESLMTFVPTKHPRTDTDFWYSLPSTFMTPLADGWFHYEYTNSGTSAQSAYIAPKNWGQVIPGEKYTFLIEVKNATGMPASGNFAYMQEMGGAQFWGNAVVKANGTLQTTYIKYEDLVDGAFTKRFVKLADVDHLSTTTYQGMCFRYRLYLAPSATVSFDIRISVYPGDYDGPYNEYLTATSSAQLMVANDEIDARVEKNGVIAAINASVEEEGGSAVKIIADKVNIEGAAIFTGTGRLSSTSLNNAYDAKGAASTAETNAKNYADGLPSYKVISNTSYHYSTANWLKYSEEGSSWGWTAITGVKVGDMLLVHGINDDTNSDVYCLITVTELTSSGAVKNATSHGLIDPEAGKRADAAQSSVDNLQIGGRNLLRDTDHHLTTLNGSVFGGESRLDAVIPAGEVVTISMDVDADDVVWADTGNKRIGCELSFPKADSGTQYVGVWAGSAISEAMNVVEVLDGSMHKRISKTFTLLGDIPVGRDVNLYIQAVSSGTISIGRVKLERGSKATDWTPAPEDQVESAYATCSTAAGTAAKVVDASGMFDLHNGVTISVKFTTANTADAPTLNVNGTGAYPVWNNNAVAASGNPVKWGANATLSFVFDGSHWILAEKAPSYSIACSTAATTRAKAATINGALVVNGTTVAVLFSTANTYVANSVQFNLSSTGAVNIYLDRAATSATHTFTWSANTVITLVRYGAYWYVSDGRAKEAVSVSQRIYYRSAASTKPDAPTAWVEEATENVYDAWTTKVPPLAASTAEGQTKYIYLWTCEQRKAMSGSFVGCTDVQLDENTTVIDGGNIITHSIAAESIQANSLTLGQISTTTQADILNSKVVVGGRNLLRKTASLSANDLNLARATVTEDGLIALTPTTSAAYASFKVHYLDFDEYGSGTYTVSFDAKLSDATTTYTTSNVLAYLGFQDPARVDSAVMNSTYDRYTPSRTLSSELTNEWQRFETVVNVPDDLTSGKAAALSSGYMMVVELGASGSKKPILIRHVKLEKGTKATDWTPAPEDQEDYVNSSVSGISESVSDITAGIDQINDDLTEKSQLLEQLRQGLQEVRNMVDGLESTTSWLSFTEDTGLVIGDYSSSSSFFYTQQTGQAMSFNQMTTAGSNQLMVLSGTNGVQAPKVTANEIVADQISSDWSITLDGDMFSIDYIGS